MVIEMLEKEFRKEVLESQKPAVVLFYMSHCPYCTEFLPKFRELFRNMGTMTAQVDISDFDSGLWNDYRIEAVPTVIAFRQGRVCARADAIPHEGLGSEHVKEEMRNKPECFQAISDSAKA